MCLLAAAVVGVGATPASAALPGSLVSACSGVSLPRSVVTDIVRTPLNSIVSPLQGTVNSILGVVGIIPIVGQVFPTLNINVNGLLDTAAGGAPISLSVLDSNGTIIGPSDQCNTTTDSIQLNTPAGIAIGGNRITGLGANNQDAVAGDINAVALGNNAVTSAAATGAVAIGRGAQVTTANGVAIGAGSIESRGATAGYTAVGLATPQTSVGAVSVGAAGATRQIINVAAGSAATDAVNVGQLQGIDAQADLLGAGVVASLGGGATYNPATGAVTAPTFPVQGNNYNNVGGALAALDGQVTTNTTNIAGNTTAITTLSTSINAGTIGLVRQTGGAPGAGQITVGAATGGTSVSVAGTSGDRTVTGVAAGVAGNDAVNVSQLGLVTGLAANAVQYDLDGLGARQNSVTLVGGAAGPVRIANVAAGALNATSGDAVNGSQLFATNGQVTTNTSNIATNTTNIAGNTANIATNTTNIANNTTSITNLNNGTAGLVRQVGGAPGAGLITVGASTGGTAVSVAGTDGDRTVTGVAAGVAANDAVNVSQLGAIGVLSANAVQYDLDGGGVRTNRVKLSGGAAGPVLVTNLQAGDLSATSTDAVNGGQLFATNTAVTNNSTSITNLTTTINNGGIGLVQQVGGAPGPGQITVGATTGGTSLSVAGTDGVRVVSGVGAGVALTDAVNVGQLAAVGAASVNAVQYDTDGGGNRLDSVTLIGGTAAPVAINNVAAGTLSATSAQAVNGSQLFATNGQVTTNTTNIATNTTAITNLTATVNTNTTNIATNTTNIANNTTNIAANTTNIANNTTAIAGNTTAITNLSTTVAGNTTAIAGNTTAITNLTTNINNGSIGLVQQTGGSPGNGAITVGAATGGTSIVVSGTGGDRVVTGVAAGVAGNDAATVGQLAAVVGGSFNAVQYDTVDGGRINSVTLVGGAPGTVAVTNVSAGALVAGSTDAVNGGQLAATNANVANNTIIITNNTTAINSILTGSAGSFQSNNVSLASAPVASGANASAGGFGSVASGVQSVALGNTARATGSNSVAIGYGSSDGGASNVASFGSAGAERRLTNVGPAINGTDAVNLSQLQAASAQFQTGFGNLQGQINTLSFDISQVRRRANAGTAGALAAAGLPQAFTAGAGMVGAAIGEFEGQVAFAFGLSKIIGDQTVVKAAGTVTGRGQAGFNAGIGYQF